MDPPDHEGIDCEACPHRNRVIAQRPPPDRPLAVQLSEAINWEIPHGPASSSTAWLNFANRALVHCDICMDNEFNTNGSNQYVLRLKCEPCNRLLAVLDLRRKTITGTNDWGHYGIALT